MFTQLNMTNAGALLASKTALGDQIEFTRIKMGDGAEPIDYRILTDLVSVRQNLPIARAKIVDINTIALGGNLYPADITQNFYWREVGVFARNVTEGTPETLFSYGYTYSPSFVSAGGTITEKMIDIDLQLSNAENVVINLDYSNLFPTKEELEESINNLDVKVQNDIRSSKNIWLVTNMGDLPGDEVTVSQSSLANLNTVSTGEQAVPNVGDLVITSDGHIGYIEGKETNNITITTITNPVERKRLYSNGDWEWYRSQQQGGGHYLRDSSTGTLIFDGLPNSNTPQIAYKRFAGNGGGDNFQIEGGTGLGARILTAWSGGAEGQGQLKVFYTSNRSNDNYTADDEIATQGWAKTYLADNTGIFVGVADTYADLIAGNIVGTPAGHIINLNDWAIVEDDETHNDSRTSYIVSENNPLTWTFATVRAEDIPAVDNSTIYLNSNGQYAIKPGAGVSLGNNTITDANIGNRTIINNTTQNTFPTFNTNTTLTGHLQQIYNALNYLNNRTVKAPSQTIYMYVQDTPVTPQAGINKVRIPITENQ